MAENDETGACRGFFNRFSSAENSTETLASQAILAINIDTKAYIFVRSHFELIKIRRTYLLCLICVIDQFTMRRGGVSALMRTLKHCIVYVHECMS